MRVPAGKTKSTPRCGGTCRPSGTGFSAPSAVQPVLAPGRVTVNRSFSFAYKGASVSALAGTDRAATTDTTKIATRVDTP